MVLDHHEFSSVFYSGREENLAAVKTSNLTGWNSKYKIILKYSPAVTDLTAKNMEWRGMDEKILLTIVRI